ncbi:MAG: dihydrofolate reductase family protein [Salibacteraceae bacterium]
MQPQPILREVIAYLACSLDGYIAGPNGELDWLNAFDPPQRTDYGYGTFYRSVDTVIMGRKTYEEVMGFGVDWPYPDCKTYVMSRQTELSVASPDTQLAGPELMDQVRLWQQEKGKNIWLCGGGEVIKSFLNAGLVDQLWLSLMPVTLGDGLRLFPGGFPQTHWELIELNQYKGGVVGVRYVKQSKEKEKP